MTETVIHAIPAVAALLITVLVLVVSARAARLSFALGLSIGLFHLFCSLSYYLYSLHSPSDAATYYLRGVGVSWSPEVGTKTIIYVSSLLSWLGFDLFSSFLLFGCLGIASIIILFRTLRGIWPVYFGAARYLPYGIALMPSLHYWSSAIGKDAPALLAACIASYASLALSKRAMLFGFAAGMMFLVRPHVAAIMLVSLLGAVVVSRKGISVARRGTLMVLGLGLSAVVVPMSLSYVGVDALSVDAVSDVIESRQGYNLQGGSSVDISGMSTPMRLFTYLFRPLFVDAHSAMALVSSAENLFLVLFFVISIPGAVVYVWKVPFVAGRYNAIFALALTLVLASTTANLGIAVRQKTMVLPSFFVLFALGANWREAQRTQRRPRSVVPQAGYGPVPPSAGDTPQWT